MGIKPFFKIILLNTTFLGAFLLLIASCFELITRSSNPFSLFPPELTKKNNIILDDKIIAFADARPSVSLYEPKTKTHYVHNDLGFRAQSITDRYTFASKDSNNSILLSVGDSTNYGLNIGIENTFSFKYAQKLNQSLINISYPGINLNGIYYKLSCALTLHEKQILPVTDILISFYYNDVETLDELPLDPTLCNNTSDLNLAHSFMNLPGSIQSEHVVSRRSFWKKLLDLNAYPSRLNRLFCSNIYPMTCKYLQFSISNISPAFRNVIFGSTREDLAEHTFQRIDPRLHEWQLKYQAILSKLSTFANITLVYIPRNELDLGFFDNKREKVYGYFKILCSSNSKLRCIDGADFIMKSLSPNDLSQFKTSQRLPINYYSYLPMYDLGHPSEFVSNLYANALFSFPR